MNFDVANIAMSFLAIWRWIIHFGEISCNGVGKWRERREELLQFLPVFAFVDGGKTRYRVATITGPKEGLAVEACVYTEGLSL